MTALNVVVVIITAPRMKFKLLVNAGTAIDAASLLSFAVAVTVAAVAAG